MAWASRQEDFRDSCGYRSATQLLVETLYKHTIRQAVTIGVEMVRPYPC